MRIFVFVIVCLLCITCSKRNPDASGLEGTWMVERTSMKGRGAIWDSATARFKAVDYYCFPIPSDDFGNYRHDYGEIKIVRRGKENFFELDNIPGNELARNSFKLKVEGDSIVLADNAVFYTVDDNGITKKLRPVFTYDIFKVKRTGLKTMKGRIILIWEASQCKKNKNLYEMDITDIEMKKK